MKKLNGDNIGGFLDRILYFYQCISDHKKDQIIFLILTILFYLFRKQIPQTKLHQEFFVIVFGVQ